MEASFVPYVKMARQMRQRREAPIAAKSQRLELRRSVIPGKFQPQGFEDNTLGDALNTSRRLSRLEIQTIS
jgi:hypothetical protein